jgi:MoaA/NifB/PqqE/SkfB family radical SAM enzyme
MDPEGSRPRQGFLRVGADGSLLVPRELARRFGLEPGALVPIEQSDEQITVGFPASHLARVYVEPTNACPLSCRTCMRHTWSEPEGVMSDAVFDRIEQGLRELPFLPSVFFGGFGEPLSHPGILGMVRRLKARGAAVDLITNGTTLDEATARRLAEAGLDTLWVSLDGATRECYGELRNATAFDRVVEGLRQLKVMRWHRGAQRPALGIAFVATERNRAELPKVIELGLRLGATRFSITNVHPHTEELEREILYGKTVGLDVAMLPRVDLARMDDGNWSSLDLTALIAGHGLQLHDGRPAARTSDSCPFIRRGSISIRWDGAASPCLPLLHTHTAWLGGRPRRIREHSFGSVADRGLRDIWEDRTYAGFRRRVQEFDFPPCHRCNQCELVESNQEDCLGNAPPCCGGCLWAQGFILCP